MKKTWFKLSAIIISIILVTMVGITGCTDQTGAQIKSINSSISTLKTDVETLKTDVSGLPTVSTVTTAVSSSLASLTSKINAAETGLTEVRNQISTISSNASSANSIATSMQTKVTDLTKQLDDIKKVVIELQAIDSANKADITTLKTEVAALKAAGNTVTTGGAGTTTTANSFGVSSVSGVVVNVQNNAFSGYPYMAFSGASASGIIQNQSFSFTISNNTGKNLSNMQIGIGFATVNSLLNAQVTLPTDCLPTLTSAFTSSGFATTWTYQGYSGGYYQFTNSSLGGIFGTIGGMSQGQGITTYNLTLTLTTGVSTTVGNSIPQFNVIPRVILQAATVQ